MMLRRHVYSDKYPHLSSNPSRFLNVLHLLQFVINHVTIRNRIKNLWDVWKKTTVISIPYLCGY